MRKTSQERIDNFYKLYTVGDMTLQQISDLEKISRERCRQILNLHPLYKTTPKKHPCYSHPQILEDRKCLYSECDKTFHVSKLRKQDYCSRKCFYEANGRKMWPSREAALKYKNGEYNRVYHQWYYHNVLKLKPDFKKVISERKKRNNKRTPSKK